MKKIIITALLLLVFVGVKAQDFGVKFGLNYNNWHTSEDISDDTDPLANFHAGAFANFELSEKITLQTELQYSVKGIVLKDGGNVNVKQNYLAIPMLFSYKINEAFAFNLGPEVDFLLSAKATDGGDNIDVKEIFEDFDYGLNFGFSYETPSGLLFDARYNLGLANMVSDEFNSDGDDIYNRVFQLSVGYVIPMNSGGSTTNNITF